MQEMTESMLDYKSRCKELERQRREDMQLMRETVKAQKLALATIEAQKKKITRLRGLLKECMTLFALGASAMARQGHKKAVKFDEKRAKAREIERKIIDEIGGAW